MQETIIFAPGANGTELLRTMARFGKNNFNTRVMNALDLARDALIRSGIVEDKEFLPHSEESSVIDSFVREVKYFEAASYEDAVNLADSIYSLRSFILADEEEFIKGEFINKAEFTEKNKAIAEIYNKYKDHLIKKNQTDTIGIIRKAIKEAKPYENASLVLLKEYQRNPLEELLINTLFKVQPDEVCISSMLEKKEGKPFSYTEAYGGSNEVEAVIEYIFRNKIPTDQCTVAVAEPGKYSQLFYDFSAEHNIATTFGCGVPIANSNPAKLLKAIYSWNTEGMRGTDALLEILLNEAFDRRKFMSLFAESEHPIEREYQIKKLAKAAGNLKLGFNDIENQKLIGAYAGSIDADNKKDLAYANILNILSKNFLSLGYYGIIEEYSVIRSEHAGRIDAAALKAITAAIKNYVFYAETSNEHKIEKVIERLFQKSVCTENCKEGMLHVTTISGALGTIRPYLFVAGLSADNFPGKPTENYLILDSDYEILGNPDKAPTSVNKVFKNKEALNLLLENAKALGAEIHLSYSNYEPAELKASNPSSVLFDIYRDENGADKTNDEFKKAFSKVSYFKEDILKEREIGRAYIAGKKIVPAKSYSKQFNDWNTGVKENLTDYLDLEFSPSAIEDYFTCPHHFYLKRILGIPEPEENDPFEIISAIDLGLLAHTMMERLGKKGIDNFPEADFIQEAEEEFKYYLKSKPPVNEKGADRELNIFLKMMKNGYEIEAEKRNSIAVAEGEMRAVHPTGIKLFGRADRIEKTSHDTHIIADFKTGRKIRHAKDDIKSCLQAVIYAFLAEENGMDVEACEYRYLRNKQIISATYDEAMKLKLNEKLEEFKAGLIDNSFAAPEKCPNTYCKLRGICTIGKAAIYGKEAD